MKHTANIISIIRIMLSLILFFVFNHTWLFIVLYMICGVSDVLDGYIARKTKTQSELGSRLDSIADLILYTLITVSVILWMGNGMYRFLPILISIIIIRLANIAIAAYKFHSFAMLHTWGNKITGFLTFIVPLFLIFKQYTVLWIICFVAVLSAIEETVIHISSTKPDLNRHSIFKI
ncbi:MAG: CDP-alcohol phosphatidyltransferase family protein [Anaerocolumna sp.]